MKKMGKNGSPSKVESRSTIRPSQERLVDVSAGFIEPRIGTGATAFPGETFAGQPGEFFESIAGYLDFQDYGDIQDLITSMSTPSYVHDPTKVAESFQTGFADPLMETFNRKVLPNIKESFAGDLFSTRTGDVLAEKSSEFVGDVISPALFAAQTASERLGVEAAETAKGRAMIAQNIPFQKLQQDIMATTALQTEAQKVLTDAYNRFLRTAPEQDPWLQLASQFAGLQTMETVGMQGTQGTDYLGLAATLGTAALIGSDWKIKDVHYSIPTGLSVIEQLTVYKYNLKETPEETEIGIMAQDLKDVVPDAVKEINGILHVKPMAVISLLINAVKGLKSEIDTMKGI